MNTNLGDIARVARAIIRKDSGSNRAIPLTGEYWC